MPSRRRNSNLPTKAPLVPVALSLSLALVLVGCRTRGDYRRWADCEVAEAIVDKQSDERWRLPDRPVSPDSRSRMADPQCPDCGPLPPDDPAAHRFMEFPDRLCGWPCWHGRGDLPYIEFPDWQQYLPLDGDGVLRLNRETAIELARLHSREYQDQVEQLYFTALAFTFERFEFDTQWFYRSSNTAALNGVGGPPTESRLLSTGRNAGFTKNLTIGGQLLVDFANSFVWEFAGDTVSNASSGLLVSLTQPLLRGAFREVRLESLTQSERNLLYNVRDFGRFRRTFYTDLVGNGYLPLLAIAQSIKNLERNLESLERNLEEHEQLSRAGLVAPIQVDQVFQQYQQGRLSLLSAQQSLQTALDQFKLLLGLPPQLEIELDPETLSPFELNDPDIEALQEENEQLRLELVQSDEPPALAEIKQRYDRLKNSQDKMVALKKQLQEEFDRWSKRLKDSQRAGMSADDQETLDRQLELAERLGKALEEFDKMAAADGKRIAAGAKGEWLPPEKKEEDDGLLGSLKSLDDPAGDGDEADDQDDPSDEQEPGGGVQKEDDDEKQVGIEGLVLRELFRRKKSAESKSVTPAKGGPANDEEDKEPKKDEATKLWESLQELVGKRLRKQLSDLFVIQAQVRVYLIESTPTEVDEEWAIQVALDNRLDLMNARGTVVDAYRRVEVAADALEAELNLQMQASLGTDPGRANPVRFDASANRYRVGFEFDSPLTRLAERNAYRAAQINYQQARRAYMATKDTIVAAVRSDIRQVEFNRFSFEIAKLQLLTAARQVDEAQVNLRNSNEPNSSFTRNLLEALQGLLGAKNNLIQSWVSYEASRMALYRDLDQMQIDANGTWVNESSNESSSVGNDALFFDEAENGYSAPGEFDSTDFERRYIDTDSTGPGEDFRFDPADDTVRLPGIVQPAKVLRLPQPAS
jgi:outer membrane protein TolC